MGIQLLRGGGRRFETDPFQALHADDLSVVDDQLHMAKLQAAQGEAYGCVQRGIVGHHLPRMHCPAVYPQLHTVQGASSDTPAGM